MASSASFGGSVNSTTGWTEWVPVTEYRSAAGSFPAGNARLDGSADNIYLHSVSIAYSGSGYSSSSLNDGIRNSSGGAWMRGGNAYQANLNKGGSGRMYVHRNSGAGGTIYNTRDANTRAGSLCGSYNWSTAPSAPVTISPSIEGRVATVSFGASANGGNETITGYTVQSRYSTDDSSWGAWGDDQASSGSAVEFTDLEVGFYQFRVYASNYLTAGAATASSSFEVKSGGKRHTGGGTYVDTATFKRHTGGGTYVDVAAVKRHTGGGTYVDVG